MATFRVEMVLERVVTFFVEADDQQIVEDFMYSNPEFKPGDVPGLIDLVGDEYEADYYVMPENDIVAGFGINDALELEELES